MGDDSLVVILRCWLCLLFIYIHCIAFTTLFVISPSRITQENKRKIFFFRNSFFSFLFSFLLFVSPFYNFSFGGLAFVDIYFGKWSLHPSSQIEMRSGWSRAAQSCWRMYSIGCMKIFRIWITIFHHLFGCKVYTAADDEILVSPTAILP